jgi:VanZ family protein
MISYIFSVNRFVRVLVVVMYVGCIAALSLMPPQDLPRVPLFNGADKVVHFMMYFLFSILFCWALNTGLSCPGLFFIVSVTVGWGALMEYLQLIMHIGRSFSWSDILANSLGVLSGVAIYKLGLLLKSADKSQKT